MSEQNRCKLCGLLITEDNSAFKTNVGYVHDVCPIADERTKDAVRLLIESNKLEHQKLLGEIFTKLFMTKSPAKKKAFKCKKCGLQFLTSVRGNSAKCSFCGASNWVPSYADELLDETNG